MLNLSKYNFNVLLFGGEASMHKDINEVKELFLSSPKVNKLIVLSNGLLPMRYYEDNRVEYCITLHNHITDKQFRKFVSTCEQIDNLIVNVIIEDTDLFRTRYHQIKQFKVEFSQIYNDDTIVDNITLPDYIEYDDGYYRGGINMKYDEFFRQHKTMDLDDIKYCEVKELNININGQIKNDCGNVDVNVFTNPLFFKNYDRNFKCSHKTCKDCTGTIRTTKHVSV